MLFPQFKQRSSKNVFILYFPHKVDYTDHCWRPPGLRAYWIYQGKTFLHPSDITFFLTHVATTEDYILLLFLKL